MSKKNVAIIGAAGFVGIELVNQLESIEGYNFFAVTRDNGSFLLQDKKVTVLNEKEIESTGPFDVVINLAYPTTNYIHLFPQANQGILGTIKRLCNPSTRIIHVSTQAVFGFGMDKPLKLDFLPERRDYAYVEAKLSMENLIKKALPNNDLAIVRLGNVWGEASGAWTGRVADRLLFGSYTGVQGRDGWGNITDVKNVASYLIFLMQLNELKGTHFYHLAELGETKWSEIVSRISKELNVEPVYSDVMPGYSTSLKQDVSGTIQLPKLGPTYRELVWGRFSGSYLRSIIRFLGDSKFASIKKTETKSLPITSKLSKDDEVYLNVVISDVLFKNHTHPDWKPLLNFDQSWELVRKWMHAVGYVNN